jgi:anti-sigma B factor antagonist
MSLQIERIVEPEGPVLALAGELDVYTSVQLKELIRDVFSTGTRVLTLDLSQVERLDASGLGVLVGGIQRAYQQDGKLVVRGMQGRARRVAEITGVLDLLSIHD